MSKTLKEATCLCFDCKCLIADKRLDKHWSPCGCGSWKPDYSQLSNEEKARIKQLNDSRHQKSGKE